MSNVSIRNEFVELLGVLGDVESEVDDALRRYLLDRASERLELCRKEIRHFEQIYGRSFDDFASALASENNAFLDEVERRHPTWEADYNTWETYVQEFERPKRWPFPTGSHGYSSISRRPERSPRSPRPTPGGPRRGSLVS